jgi:hypothetical protein
MFNFFKKSVLMISPELGSMLYRLLFFLNLPLLKLISKKIWFRNSLYFKRVVLGLSDFDLAVFLEKKVDAQKQKDILFINKILKRTLGRMGEMVIYSQVDLETFLPFANPLELKRDPYFSSHDCKATKAQRWCFFIKMYNSDRDKIDRYPALRVRKWSYLFEILGFDVELNAKNLKLKLNEIADTLSGSENVISIDDLLFSPTLWTEFQKLNTLNSWEREVLTELVKWEIWGLYTQRVFLNRENLEKHKENLKSLCELHLKDGCEVSRMSEAISLL